MKLTEEQITKIEAKILDGSLDGKCKIDSDWYRIVIGPLSFIYSENLALEPKYRTPENELVAGKRFHQAIRKRETELRRSSEEAFLQEILK